MYMVCPFHGFYFGFIIFVKYSEVIGYYLILDAERYFPDFDVALGLLMVLAVQAIVLVHWYI